MKPITLAKAIKKAYELKEENYDKKLGKYILQDEECLEKAFQEFEIDDDFVYPIYLGFNWVNDMMEWVNDMIEKESL